MSKIIEINNDLADIKYFYVDQDNKSVKFLDNLDLTKFYHIDNLDKKIIKKCINQKDVRFHTIIKDVFFLPRNFNAEISFDINSNSYKLNIVDNFIKDKNNIEYSDFFQEFLYELIVNENRYNIAVSFSAGLDSSSILFSLTNIKKIIPNIKIIAFCWYGDSLSSNEDLIFSKSICDDLKIDFYAFKINPNDLFESIADFQYQPIIDPSIGFMKIEKHIQEELSKIFNGDHFLILNGHGGDHLFLDPLPFSVVLKNRKNILSLFRKIQNYYSVDYFTIFRNIITDFFHEKNISFENQRMNAIYQACIDNSWNKEVYPYAKILYPFTQRKNIDFCLKFNLESILDLEYSRNVYRKSMYKKFSHPVFLRNSKGHITGIYQLCAKYKKKEIIDLLREGYLVKNNIIDISDFEQKIEMSSLGYGGFPPEILLSICCEILIKNLL